MGGAVGGAAELEPGGAPTRLGSLTTPRHGQRLGGPPPPGWRKLRPPHGASGAGAWAHGTPGRPQLPPPPFVSNLTLHTVSGGKVFIILNYYCFEINGRFSSHAALHDLWKDRVELLGRGLRDTWTGHQSPTQVPGARDHRMTSKTRTKLLRQTFFKGKNMCILKAI